MPAAIAKSFAELEAAGVTWVMVSGSTHNHAATTAFIESVRIDLLAVAVRIVARCQSFGSVCSVPRRSRRPRSCGLPAPSTKPRSLRSRRGIADRAQAFASKHRIPKVHDSYASLLDDPDIDAIYNPLPNGLHGRWTIAALEAGKHVLCEKPFTANADEAETSPPSPSAPAWS